MRKIILPVFFFIVTFTIATNSNAQPNSGNGTACTAAPSIQFNGSCANFVLGAHAVVTGNPVYCTGLPSGGRVYWIKFSTTLPNQCVSLDIHAFDNVTDDNIPVEVAFYRRNNPMVDPCDGVLQGGTDGSMCFNDGIGIWAPTPPNFNLQANSEYFIRLYSPLPPSGNLANIRYNICGRQYQPLNDFCTDATPIPATPAGEGVEDNNVCATATGETNTTLFPPGWVCAGQIHNLAWYTFTVASTGVSTINLSGGDCDTYLGAAQNVLQAGLMVLKPGRNCTDAIGQNGPGSPLEPAGSGGNPIVCTNATSTNLSTRSLPAGTRVFLAIDGYLGANCRYILSGTTNIVPIPVTLKNFDVWKNGSSNKVRWVTSWEQNNAHFDIERSFDGVHFEKLGSVKGKGNSNEDVDYLFEDNNPPLIGYYRLKQVDTDGKFTYSRIAMVRRESSSLFGLSFANPVKNSEQVTISTQQPGLANLQVVDVAGRNVSLQRINCSRGNTIITSDFSKLPPGNYYMVLTQEGNKLVKPFIKQ